MDLNPQALITVVERIAASGQKEPVALLVRAQIRRRLHEGPPRRGTETRRMSIRGDYPPAQMLRELRC